MSVKNILKQCRLCRSDKINLLLEREDISIFKCLDCGIVFLGNEMDDASMKGLYRYYGQDTFTDSLSPVTRLRYERLLDIFDRYRKNNAIIDVGCGAGHFMLSASERGWRADGTEISDEAIELSVKKEQKVIRGDIASLVIEKHRYDIATLFELMEHASDPEGIVKKIAYIVRPGGLVYITTPNYNSIARILLGRRWGIFHKEHIFYFTAENLMSLLNKYNFKIKKIRTENLSLREFLSILRYPVPLNAADVRKKQETLRGLAENSVFFSVLKRLVNYILNIFKAGDTIYIFAEAYDK